MSLNKMKKNEKIGIGILIWFGICFVYGTYSSFIPSTFMKDGVQTYVPYLFAAVWILFICKKDRKEGQRFFSIRIKDLEKKKSILGHPIPFYIVGFVLTPLLIVFVTWMVLFTQTNVWGQITSWQYQTDSVTVEQYRIGRSKRSIGSVAFWVRDQDGERYCLMVRNSDLYIRGSANLETATRAKVDIRKGPLGRFVEKITLLGN
jgi:hypothetical protein